MCGSESGFIELMFGFSFIVIAIFFGLWRKEVNRRERQSKELLEDIKSSFGGEITYVVNSLIETIGTILPEFTRGRYSIFLENAVSNLSEKFSESAFSLRDKLNALSVEVDELKAKEEAIAIRAISNKIVEMKILLDDFIVKSIFDAITYGSRKDELIEQLNIAQKRLQGLVANRHSEPKDEMSSEE